VVSRVDKLFEQFARVGKALANPHRLELLDLLAQGERTVEDLADERVFSDEAVVLLRSRGYRARRLQEGFPDWRAAALPVET
jgi:hypothetical protein